MKMFYWFAVWGSFCFFKLFYRFKTLGREHIPQGAAILAPNHVSYFDPPMVGSSLNEEVHFLANAKYYQGYWLKKMFLSLNAHPIHLNSADPAALKLVVKLLKNGNKVVVFPEGTRSPTGELLPFKEGCALLAFLAKVPVVPVGIRGPYEVWPKKQRWPKLKGRFFIEYGPAIYPDAFANLSRKERQKAFMEVLQQKVEQLSHALK